MTRIQDARKAYLEKDINKLKASHLKNVVDKDAEHKEKHLVGFNLPEIILGGQDGLVNVLGVILGVAAATASSKVVIVAGLAATFAESVSMAAVAYTSKLAEADYYQSEMEREKWEIENAPEGEVEEIRVLYRDYGFEGEILEDIVKKITSDKDIWLKIMMEQELKLQRVDRKQALPSGFLVGISALIGSFIPLTAYFFLPITYATIFSLILAAGVLFAAGYYKAKVTLGRNFMKEAIKMLLIGMLSAFVGYLVGIIFKV
ncbi:MAG: VIT1/CCC1 transporter family protein [Patescibacteria group bacterium]